MSYYVSDLLLNSTNAPATTNSIDGHFLLDMVATTSQECCSVSKSPARVFFSYYPMPPILPPALPPVTEMTPSASGEESVEEARNECKSVVAEFFLFDISVLRWI